MSADGKHCARALRRVAKRRDALSTASPYIVAIIGVCDTFLYCNGVLCYTLDDQVRVLELHRSTSKEVVFSIPGLLNHALSQHCDSIKGVFQVLYYADYIITCVYKSLGEDATAWLVSFNLRKSIVLVVHELESTDKIFVRHNKEYLYYGTHSDIGADGYKKWVLHGYEFESKRWFDEKIRLPDMVGSEIGSTICFEFHNDYFYALSNQTSFEVEEIDWTSFYHCVRFPLNSPSNQLVEKTENKNMWRRQHQEGPIDDRWTVLRLDVDEASGELKIVEARKEWYLGSSKSQRTYYKTDIIFPKLAQVDDLMDEGMPAENSSDFNSLPPPTSSPAIDPETIESSSSALTPSASSASASSSSSSTSITSTSTSTGESSSSSASSKTIPTSTIASTSDLDASELEALPNVPLRRLLGRGDHPNHLNAPAREPENTHPGDDGSTKPTFTLAKSCIRTYNMSCNTFLDLVNDPLPTDPQNTQRIRLRSGTRKLGPVLLDKEGIVRAPSPDLQTALKEIYRVSPIQYWPAAQDPDQTNEDLDAIYRILNPPELLGNVEGTADERSMVYATGGGDKPRALVFLGFDPAMRLAGIKQWNGLRSRKGPKGVGEGPHIDGRATGMPFNNDRMQDVQPYVDVEERDRTVSIDRKGKGREICSTIPIARGTGHNVAVVSSSSRSAARVGVARQLHWIKKEAAMYQTINTGLYFGLDPVR